MLFFRLFHVKHTLFFPGETLFRFHDAYSWILRLLYDKQFAVIPAGRPPMFSGYKLFHVKRHTQYRIPRVFHT